MKQNKILLLPFLFLLLFNSCNKKEFDRKNFLVVETGSITASTTESVTLNSNILGFESGKITAYGYAYSSVSEVPTLDSELTEYKSLGVRLAGGEFTATIENLDDNTTYYISAFALLEGELEAVYGDPVTFRTTDYSLLVTTDSFDFKPGGFELFGSINGIDSGLIVSKYGFIWSIENEEPELAIDNPVYMGSIDDNTAFSKRLENVIAEETYYVRSFAEVGADVFYGETISFFKGDVWSEREVPDAREGTYFSVVNGKAYIGGGYRAGAQYDLQVYDPLLNTWEYGTPLSVLCNHGAAFTIEDTLYVVSGNDGINNTLWAYNTTDKTWSTRAPFPSDDRSFCVAHAVKGKGYLAMGRGGAGSGYMTEVWRYDPSSDSWMQMPSFPGGNRVEPIIFTDEEKLYIGFGQGNNNMYAFDVDLMEWGEEIEGVDLDPFDVEHFSCFRIGDKAYLLLGIPEDNFWEYDIPSGVWLKKSDFEGDKIDNPVFFEIEGRGFIGMGSDGFSGVGFNWKMWKYTPDRR